MGIVRFALRWPYTFYVLALLILFLGVTVFRSMPADIFPEIDIPVVTVIWQYTGLRMEQRVTTYSEYAISSVVGDRFWPFNAVETPRQARRLRAHQSFSTHGRSNRPSLRERA